ncbi:tRNA (guanosine(46)-N7)-methyltransferase TrmB [Aerococcus suis]|uniref:tRNA (guanine-N(7)-)-methyltransferase n=1 Tax=Aerococcus suis TaxID=371602 RepID=A0A1W1YIL7_9LACT|nr:tRNA (guanosine(46)-N7)-methyltransferase TrmB [Aerococcus suis]SMC35956.1 tRNA (guanine-N(7)-)-methyltransferase [Aerococcus suis]
MRVRHKPWAKDLLNEHPEYVVQASEDLKGEWESEFKNTHPIHLEVGSGKGQFIVGMAKKFPDINFIGIEMFDSVLVTALQRALEEDLPNLRLIRTDGRKVSEYFASGEVEQLYLNFSDPWPKKRHAKRRLTHKNFLSAYENILPKEGRIQFKTDNQGLFEYSLCSMSQYGMVFDNISLDLHHSDIDNHVMTEYEEKFSKKGQRINYLLAHFKA